ncbi:MAG: glycosyltransferase [Planctomycetota bacterium]
MKIAQVSFAETGGGAERVATDLHDCFLRSGHDAVMLTPRPDAASQRDGVFGIDVDWGRNVWERTLSRVDRRLARPRAALRRRRGYDDPHHPWTSRLLDLIPWTPDVLHLHNLHGNWFDLRQLGLLSQRVKTVITLHDAWLPLAGPHWPMHIGQWDAAALRANQALRDVALRDTKLTVVTPSLWMKSVWDTSPWSSRLRDAAVIPNGIDLELFSPGESREGSSVSAMPPEARVILSVGITGRGTPSHTDPASILEAAPGLPDSLHPLVVVNVGEPIPAATFAKVQDRVRMVQTGRLTDRQRLIREYRAATALFHPVHEDNAPLTVIEAMACGTPIVAPRVGGIPDLCVDGEHARLYDKDDLEDRRNALCDVLRDPVVAHKMGMAAAAHVRKNFDRRRMADDYIRLYRDSK